MSMGLPTLLFVMFICLKLCGVIAWSWWIVFLPVFIPLGIVVLVFLALIVVGATVKRV